MAEIPQVPMAAFEAEQARTSHIIYCLIVAWMVSVLVLGFALIASMCYEEETVSEVITDVDQNADNYGSTYFSNGDLVYGGATDNTDN